MDNRKSENKKYALAFQGKVFFALDEYFNMLDEAIIGEGSLFSKREDKGFYETKCMYAFRKYRGAFYHFVNVKRLIKNDAKQYQKLVKPDKLPEPLKEATFEVRVWGSANEYAYELSAFLDAIKSSMDFLVKVLGIHTKGARNLRGISTLIHRVEKGSKNGVFDLIKRYYEWIRKLREYRARLIHVRTFTCSTGYESITTRDKTEKLKIPVIIPEVPPPFALDTRESRYAEDEIKGFERSERRFIVKTGDTTPAAEKLDKVYKVLPGYVDLKEFMEETLTTFEDFFCDFINFLKSLEFEEYILE